jgi:diguanylate cyclase (GGDEF)-like protein/PAS domain S-box-containing protein
MEKKKKNKNKHKNKAIDSLKKQIKKSAKVGIRLEKKEKELEDFERTFEKRVEIRTSAERIIHRQLRSEIAYREQLERELEDSLEYANGIINTVRDPLIILDGNLIVISASPSFYRIFNVKCENTEKQHIYSLGNRQWDIPKLRELLEDILPHVTTFDNFEVEHNFPDIGKRTMLLNARKIYRKTNKTQLILLAFEDITERKEAEEKLKILATRDQLTGCLNFRSIMELLENEIERAKRYQTKFSIAMMDIDHFKSINDTYGHLVGNDALIVFASVVKKSIRKIDMVGRYGGDEFIIVFPETDSQHALVALEKIQTMLNQTKIPLLHEGNANTPTLKFSVGIAGFPYHAKDLKELIGAADSALRQAKQAGGNKAV